MGFTRIWFPDDVVAGDARSRAEGLTAKADGLRVKGLRVESVVSSLGLTTIGY